MPNRAEIADGFARRADAAPLPMPIVSKVVRPFFFGHFARARSPDRRGRCTAPRSRSRAQAGSSVTPAVLAVLPLRQGQNSWSSILFGRRIDRHHVRRHQGRSPPPHQPRPPRSPPSAPDRAGERARCRLGGGSRRARSRVAQGNAGSRGAGCEGRAPLHRRCSVARREPSPARRSTADARSRSFRGIFQPMRGWRSTRLGGDQVRPASFPRFRPPRLIEPTRAGEIRPAPHIRLDRALNFLIGGYGCNDGRG